MKNKKYAIALIVLGSGFATLYAADLTTNNANSQNVTIPTSYIRILAIDPGPPVAVTFTPASAARAYTLLYNVLSH